MKAVKNCLFFKITALFCVLCAIFSFSFVSSSFALTADGEFFPFVFCDESGILYSLDAEGRTASVILGSKGAERLFVPQTVTAGDTVYTVTSVSDGAFALDERLTEIALPQTVNHIGSRAFFGCVSLESVSAEGLESVGVESFTATPFAADGEFVTLGQVLVRYNGKRTLLKSFPDGITFVGDAFAWNTYVTTVILPEGVTELGDGAFACAEELRTVSLPFSLEAVGDKAFFGCVSLKEVSLAAGVTKIGEGAFSGTPFLAELLEAQGDMLVVGGGVLLRYKGEDKNVTVPSYVVSVSDAFAYGAAESVTFEGDCHIGNGAFRGAGQLRRITVMGDGTGIDSFAFSGCNSLDAIVFGGCFTGNIERGAFKGASRDLGVYFRDGKTGFDVFEKLGIPAVSPSVVADPDGR